ncbi:hypothetical protein VTO42DRAFT_1656 [Malbranchea cinnamomea]
MALRLTTWNVNGIRNPFAYQPWRDNKSFDCMFDTLEADIVVFQETKIQRKDLRDDMVLVPGWDCYFSLPKYKKGYSGVVIYTRNSTCSPIRAEEGITGCLCPPGSSTPFRDLPTSEQIGGYPTAEQLSTFGIDVATLDSEGRCIILEFPAFVLLGVYCPANRDETRDGFRLGFLKALDCRIRNLVALGKRVVVAGDINIARDENDSAHARDQIRKGKITVDEFYSTPTRRLFNQLLQRGKVIGDRDPGREKPVLWDTCRELHPTRSGMYTCWEQRINARPGNFGARIDYVLCSLDMTDWISSANIQEGLMGSDHCPVYAVFKDRVLLDDKEFNLLDIMNPPGTFENGKRICEYSPKNLLPSSGRLLPEFTNRQSIREMFFRQPQTSQNRSITSETTNCRVAKISTETPSSLCSKTLKRPNSNSPSQPSNKRARKELGRPPSSRVGQNTIQKYFTAKPTCDVEEGCSSTPLPTTPNFRNVENPSTLSATDNSTETTQTDELDNLHEDNSGYSYDEKETSAPVCSDNDVDDSLANKESWSKLFRRKPPPKCEGHDEECISLVTKKPGINRGRSFWICPRPLGPSGNKELGTQWRCPTFIWCSDWNGG